MSGGSPFTLSDIRAGVGPNANQVTMTLNPSAEAGQTIGVAYFANTATAASKVQDLAGNAAAGFNRTSDLNPPVTVRNITLAGPRGKERGLRRAPRRSTPSATSSAWTSPSTSP